MRLETLQIFTKKNSKNAYKPSEAATGGVL